jgi:formylglycine-generating enzyme required for sulfatase activity
LLGIIASFGQKLSKLLSKHSRNNSVVSTGGPDRVLRGGGWYDDQWGVRAAHRFSIAPDYRVDDLGFRLLRTD